jgi:hypothetical protein
VIIDGLAGALLPPVLWLLALYHIVVGATALLVPGMAARMMRTLYGATLAETSALRYATSMIGALALAIGGLAAVAARSPHDHRPIVAALLALQLSRVFCRIRDRRVLVESLGVTARRNAAAIAVLGAESVILLVALR